MKIDLTDKVAVITGAAAGIGSACTRLMLENSAKVIIADVNDAEGKKTAAELSAIGPCEFICTDVSNRESVENLVESVISSFKKIDIFVNNAGINVIKNRVNIDEYATEDWEKILSVDLDGVFFCSRAVSKVMIKQKSGRIINL